MVNAAEGIAPLLFKEKVRPAGKGKQQVDRSKLGILLASFASMLLSACVAAPTQTAPTGAASAAPEPRYTSFRCDGNSEINLEDFGTSVHVIDSRGADVVLPASPPAQKSRYGEPGYALVLEGRKALWMVSGKRPVNCVM
jgi:hypothetical protein